MTNELLNLDPRSEHLLSELAPRVFGAVIRRFHDFASAGGFGFRLPGARAFEGALAGGRHSSF